MRWGETENAICPSAIGKKNWLFMGDAQTGSRAAVFYTLIGNCHLEGINATTYMTDLLTRLPSATNRTVHQLAPKAWAAEQASLRQAMAQTCVAACRAQACRASNDGAAFDGYVGEALQGEGLELPVTATRSFAE